MAVIIKTASLAAAPLGALIDPRVTAVVGAQVVIIEKKGPVTKVRLTDSPGQPEGWINAAYVDEQSDSIAGPIDLDEFAMQCVTEALGRNAGIRAHYLMSVAQVRSGIKNGANPAGFGPFALTDAEWKFFNALPELDGGYDADAIKTWKHQCSVFAVATAVMQDKLAEKLGRQPTPVELYLAQIVGAAAAKASIDDPAKTINAIIAAGAATDFSDDGVDPSTILTRYPELDKLDGKGAVAKIEAALEKALTDTAQAITKAGATAITLMSGPLVSGIHFDSPEIAQGRGDIARKVVDAFAERDYGLVQQIAALANAIAESNLDPMAHATQGEDSVGLFQLNRNGGVGADHTVAQLQDPDNNIQIMLDYIAKEKKADDANFRAAATLEDAITVFVSKFEQPANQQGAIDRRVKIAKTLA